MKAHFFALISLCALAGGCSSMTSVALPVAGAVTGGVLARNESVAIQAAAVAAGALVGHVASESMADKRARDDFQKLQIGRYQEAWIRNNTDWYYATMDRRSGLPPAFDGNWAMYSGLPDREREFVQRRMTMPDQFVPTSKDEYLKYLSLDGSNSKSTAAGTNGDLVAVPSVSGVMPARNVNGVGYRPQVREFPTLP